MSGGLKPGSVVTPVEGFWLYKHRMDEGVSSGRITRVGEVMLVISDDRKGTYVVVKLLDSRGSVWTAFLNPIMVEVEKWLKAL